VSIVRGGPSAPLIDRLANVRRQIAAQLGYLMPPVKLGDNMTLKSREYVIYLKGAEIGRFELTPGCELAIPASGSDPSFESMPTREPAFGLPAFWVASDRAEAARNAGYTVVDSLSIVGTHLAELIRRYAHELFSRQDAKALVDRVAVDHPRIVEDLVPKLLPLGVVQKVVQNLLRERVSIRDGVTLLEALGEVGSRSKNPVLLTEYVRQSLRRTLVKPYLDMSGALTAWFLDPALEQVVEGAVEHGEQDSICVLAPQAMSDVLNKVLNKTGTAHAPGVLITSANARHFVRQIVEGSAANLAVISHNEIPSETRIVSLGIVQ
jgi:flagellar biosynthesis protein FlhA